MNKDTMIERNSDHIDTRLDGEVVMMNLDTGKYFNLNETGSRIWDLLEEGPLSLDAVSGKLMAEYNIDKISCIKDIIAFFDAVKEKGLFVISG